MTCLSRGESWPEKRRFSGASDRDGLHRGGSREALAGLLLHAQGVAVRRTERTSLSVSLGLLRGYRPQSLATIRGCITVSEPVPIIEGARLESDLDQRH
jgi:hypothetical protein